MVCQRERTGACCVNSCSMISHSCLLSYLAKGVRLLQSCGPAAKRGFPCGIFLGIDPAGLVIQYWSRANLLQLLLFRGLNARSTQLMPVFRLPLSTKYLSKTFCYRTHHILPNLFALRSGTMRGNRAVIAHINASARLGE